MNVNSLNDSPVIIAKTPPSPFIPPLSISELAKKKLDNIKNTKKCVKNTPSAKIGNYIYFYPAIGRGSSSKVYTGICILTNETVAVKKINNISLQKLSLERINTEISLMTGLNHTNIIKYIDILRDNNYVYIITEYCNGGNLQKFIDDFSSYSEFFSEIEIKFYMRQLKDAFQYLHSKNIYHRDVKPQNIFINYKKGISSDYTDVILKVGDFGFAKEILEDDMENTLCGTPLYIAPEILLEKKYYLNSDLWSLGVILYQLCYSGNFPFGKSRNILELLKSINEKKIVFPIKKYKNVTISLEGYDLLSSLLEKNPNDRLSWEEFFNHAWFVFRDEKNYSDSDTDSDSEDNEILDTDIQEILKKNNIISDNAKKKKKDNINIIEDYCDKFSTSLPIPIPIIKNKSINVKNNFGQNFYRLLTNSIDNLRKYASGD